ncbi:MAG: hypothetical protein LW834_19745 [Cyanobium sp. 49614_E6]|jgi:hypothetical protein|nr:hypothetical protein [Cyanobium sp. 49614_E6]
MTPDQARGLSSVLVSSGSFYLLRRPTVSYIEIVWSGSQRQAAYFHEKVAEIQHFFPTAAQVSPGTAQSPGLRFKITSDRLRPLYNLFVPRGSRRISSACLELCGARAIAWLFSDHGRRTPRGFELGSVARHAEEAVLLAQWIKTILGVDCRARLRGRRLALLLDSTNAAKAAEQLLDYSPASRRHLFLQLLNDRDPVCDPCDLLLLGNQGAARPARQALAPLAQTPPLRA